MRRLLIALFALAAALGPVNAVTATAPPTTPPAATTTGQPGATTTSTASAPASDTSSTGDEDAWTIRRLVVTGVVVIAALAFVGWAVAKVRNELAKPSAPRP